MLGTKNLFHDTSVWPVLMTFFLHFPYMKLCLNADVFGITQILLHHFLNDTAPYFCYNHMFHYAEVHYKGLLLYNSGETGQNKGMTKECTAFSTPIPFK